VSIRDLPGIFHHYHFKTLPREPKNLTTLPFLIGEEHVVVVIVANPVAIALGLCKFLVLAAKPASRVVRFLFGWCYHVFSFRRTPKLTGRRAFTPIP